MASAPTIRSRTEPEDAEYNWELTIPVLYKLFKKKIS